MCTGAPCVLVAKSWDLPGLGGPQEESPAPKPKSLEKSTDPQAPKVWRTSRGESEKSQKSLFRLLSSRLFSDFWGLRVSEDFRDLFKTLGPERAKSSRKIPGKILQKLKLEMKKNLGHSENKIFSKYFQGANSELNSLFFFQGKHPEFRRMAGFRKISSECYGPSFRTRRIGANPEKSDLLNFRGPDWRKFSELCVLLFFLGKTDKMLPKSRFSKRIFGHSAGHLNWTGPIANGSESSSSSNYTKNRRDISAEEPGQEIVLSFRRLLEKGAALWGGVGSFQGSLRNFQGSLGNFRGEPLEK